LALAAGLLALACPLDPLRLVGRGAVVVGTHHNPRAASCWAAVGLVSGDDGVGEGREVAGSGGVVVVVVAGADVVGAAAAGRCFAGAGHDGHEG
jgi:hypothetical protein